MKSGALPSGSVSVEWMRDSRGRIRLPDAPREMSRGAKLVLFILMVAVFVTFTMLECGGPQEAHGDACNTASIAQDKELRKKAVRALEGIDASLKAIVGEMGRRRENE